MTKEQLFKLLKRQIEVSRFEAHVRRDLLKRLNKLHRQVKGRIGEEDLDTIGRRELNKLIKDITELSAVAHAELVRKIDDYSLDLIDNETDFIYKEYGDTWGVPDKKPPVVKPLILGVTANEWLSKQANDYAHSLTMAVRNNDSIDHLPRQLGNKTKAFTTTWARATSQQRQTQIAEKSKKVAGFWHVSVLDSRTSDICLVRSNKRWTMDKQPIDHDLEWKSPPLHPHCRSVMTQITDVSKEPATMTVDDWLESMSDKEQAQVLGVGKAQMYRDGKITLRDLLDQSGRPKPLKSYKQSHPEAYQALMQAQEKESKARKALRTVMREQYGAELKALKTRKIDKLVEQYNLTRSEAMSLRYYTGTGFGRLNKHLRGVKDGGKYMDTITATLNDALNKLPSHKGMVVRRDALPNQLLLQHKTGNIVEYKAFTSSTFGKVDVFDHKPHRLVIHSKTGKRIDWISAISSEDEVLFGSPTKFEVGKVERLPDGTIQIRLDEQ